MKKNDQIFHLIQSLSRSEKRFFKIYSSRHVIGAENNYVALFDAIAGLSVYDEDRLLRQFSGKKMVNRFPVAKAYLYELILKAMAAYHSGKSIENQLLDLLRNVAFLFDKKLFDQAGKQLKKAKKIAIDYEKSAILPEILHWEKEILSAQFYANSSLKEIEKLQKESLTALKDLVKINDFWILDASLYFRYHKEGIAQRKEGMRQLEEIVQNPILEQDIPSLPFKAKKLRLKIYSTWYFLQRDFKNCYPYITELVGLWESRPNIIRREPLEYIQGLNNLLNMTQVLGKSDETELILRKLEALVNEDHFKKMEEVQVRLFESFYYHQINLHQRKGDYFGGIKRVKAIEKGFQKYSKKMNPVGQLMLCFHVFRLCFGAKEYEMSLDWLSRILNQKKSQVHQELIFVAHILWPLVNFETYGRGNDTQKAVRSTYRYLMERKVNNRSEEVNRFEEILLFSLKRLPNLENKNDFQVWLKDLKQEFDLLTEDTSERQFFAYFDFRDWVENKIEQRKNEH